MCERTLLHSELELVSIVATDIFEPGLNHGERKVKMRKGIISFHPDSEMDYVIKDSIVTMAAV